MRGSPNTYSDPPRPILGVKYVGYTGHPLGPVPAAEPLPELYFVSRISLLLLSYSKPLLLIFQSDKNFASSTEPCLITAPSTELRSWLSSLHLTSLPSTWTLETAWLIPHDPTQWPEGRMAATLLVEVTRGQTIRTPLDCVEFVFSCPNSNLLAVCFYMYLFVIIVW